MEHLTDDERELLAKAKATQCWLPVNPATVVKLLEEIEWLRADDKVGRDAVKILVDNTDFISDEHAEAAKGQVKA